MPPRYAPARPLPPYAYVPGHGLPHPVNDPRGHSYSNAPADAGDALNAAAAFTDLPPDPASRCRVLTVTLAASSDWLYALDLFNGGWYWEAHEAWEGFWHVFGRTTPEARLVQGLIRLAAACVKIREGTPEGVRRHALRARELLGDVAAADRGADALSLHAESSDAERSAALGISPKSIASVLQELETFRAECWHTSRTPVVRVLAADLRLMRRDGEPHTVEG